MVELLIMRHAKSDWGVGVAEDADRPLAPRGVKAARRMGTFITRVGAAPELVLSSPAVRALETIELAAEEGRWQAQIRVVETFYGGEWADIVEGIVSLGGSAKRVLVSGHEPTWSSLVSVLTGGGRIAMPTAAVAFLAVDGDGWLDLGPGRAELRWHVTPRMLKGLL